MSLSSKKPRGYPTTQYENSKRLKTPSANEALRNGFEDTTDPTVFNVNNNSVIPGMMDNDASDLVNETITMTMVITNTDMPEGNNHIDNIPEGSFLFMKAPKDPNERQLLSAELGENFNYADLMEACVPQKLNYILHDQALDMKSRDFRPLSIQDVVNEWKPIGFLNDAPVPQNFRPAKNAKRLLNARFVGVVVRGNLQVLNLWGRLPSGRSRMHLHLLVCEENIGEYTQYTFGRNKEHPELRSLSNKVKNEDEVIARCLKEWNELPAEDRKNMTKEDFIRENTRLRFVPKIIPFSSNRRRPTRKELEYTVIGSDGKPMTRTGLSIYCGRVVKNIACNGELSDKPSASIKTMRSVFDITKEKMDIHINVSDFLMS